MLVTILQEKEKGNGCKVQNVKRRRTELRIGN